MAPRRSARIVGVASKRTKATAEEVLVVESLRVATVAVEKRRTETPPKVVKVVPVEETKKKAREEKAKENNDRQRSQEETPTAASEEEQRKKNEEEDADRQMSKEAKETAAPKEERKRRKKIGKENERKKIRKKRGGGGEGYRRYVFRVLKQVHPDLRISSMAMAVLNGFMNDMFERVVNEAERLSKYTRKMTLSAWEIRGAVKLLLPGELGKHAVAEGNKAVANYYSTVKAAS